MLHFSWQAHDDVHFVVMANANYLHFFCVTHQVGEQQSPGRCSLLTEYFLKPDTRNGFLSLVIACYENLPQLTSLEDSKAFTMVAPVENGLPPRFVLKIPGHRLFQATFKILQRLPTEG